MSEIISRIDTTIEDYTSFPDITDETVVYAEAVNIRVAEEPTRYEQTNLVGQEINEVVVEINTATVEINENTVICQEAKVSADEALAVAPAIIAIGGIDFADFSLVDGNLIVGYYDPETSTPSIVDGEFIITY